ncbi:LHFPL tetraspan subfamily member 6 protein-like isoform X2 [Ceratina calcarata]|uniref:LHFPL tetraspan subfamily member 6 protein-like isoform X2 n=1 Tax=Ceratina calcarata TaxID=156304 RepID=A0AAJ7W9W1_9HYME|nr:LHFPL tetraspan subfamily member 6 protein-like isoform X2 [Ceratina calcarata]
MTVLCVLWATLSTVASILACSGFYLPYWIQGRLLGKADAYFSSFRRCNYPRIRAPNTAPEIVYECARYSSFWDIPSGWWQATTVTMGIGVAIAVIGALTLLAAASSFLPHILKTPKQTRLLGSLQLLAVMICGGLVMYPIGWDNREVRESCGKGANVYNLAFAFTRSGRNSQLIFERMNPILKKFGRRSNRNEEKKEAGETHEVRNGEKTGGKVLDGERTERWKREKWMEEKEGIIL